MCVKHIRSPPKAYAARWKIVSKLVINDDPKLALRRDVQALVITNVPGERVSATSGLLLDPVRQFRYLVEYAPAFRHERSDLAICVHHGGVITPAELLSDLGQ